MGRKKQPLKPGPPSQPLPAQGKGACKRTPASSFDPAAGKDTYEPEKIVGSWGSIAMDSAHSKRRQ